MEAVIRGISLSTFTGVYRTNVTVIITVCEVIFVSEKVGLLVMTNQSKSRPDFWPTFKGAKKVTPKIVIIKVGPPT